MCGIAGIYGHQADALSFVERMTAVLAHRGPDHQGVFCKGPIALGHRRLSIVDLSVAANQPLSDRSGRYRIVFNGEIYNYRELRPELERSGWQFETVSDTEVTLAAYALYGIEGLKKLRGMFAFGIWDSDSEELLLVRDRLGKKPLYIAASAGRLAFASEIRSLRELPWVDETLDPASVHAYLALQYVPDPFTLLKGVRKLPPAHFLRVTRGVGIAEERRYWQLPAAAPDTSDVEAAVEQRLVDSVRARLVADVEVGVLLSGGLDSSLIAAIASREQKGIRSFCVGFAEEQLDERPFASHVAGELGTRHLSLAADRVDERVLHAVVSHMDQPQGDPACLPTYLIAQAAREHVRVVLTGEGSDELFSGYRYYKWNHQLRRLTGSPEWVRHLVARTVAPAVAAIDPVSSRRLIEVLTSKLGSAGWTSLTTSHERDALLQGRASQATGVLDSLLVAVRDSMRGGSIALELFDLQTWLPGDLLMKVDSMTMANSLEARVPFLDHHLVEFATSHYLQVATPAHPKALLRRIAAKYLPESVVSRRKHGFEPPASRWLRQDLRTVADGVFARDQIESTGLFDGRAVLAEWRRFADGANDGARRVWALFIFLYWYRNVYGHSAREPIMTHECR